MGKKVDYLVKILKENLKGNIEKEDIIKHSKIVKEIAFDICEKMEEIYDITIVNKADKDLIRVAAILHDIKKPGEAHHIEGEKYIIEHLDDFFEFSEEDKKLVALMVRWHRGDEEYKAFNIEQIRMIEIVRAADKISKIYKKSLKKCALKIVENISNLISNEVRNAAAIVLFEKLKAFAE